MNANNYLLIKITTINHTWMVFIKKQLQSGKWLKLYVKISN